MSHLVRTMTYVALAIVIAGYINGASADYIGFNPSDYKYNTGDTGSPPVIGEDSIRLTTGSNDRRSIFFRTKQDITKFRASFDYRVSTVGANAFRQGIAFVLQNSEQGIDALGTGGGGFGVNGISPSAALTIQLDTGSARTFAGHYTNGVVGGGAQPIYPINAFDRLDIRVDLFYDETVSDILTVTFSEGTKDPVTLPFLVGSLSTILGDTKAYVGFTANTGGGGSIQTISNFRYYTVPEASSFIMLAGVCGIGAAGHAFRRRRQRVAPAGK